LGTSGLKVDGCIDDSFLLLVMSFIRMNSWFCSQNSEIVWQETLVSRFSSLDGQFPWQVLKYPHNLRYWRAIERWTFWTLLVVLAQIGNACLRATGNSGSSYCSRILIAIIWSYFRDILPGGRALPPSVRGSNHFQSAPRK
jgi:hypothetical protein